MTASAVRSGGRRVDITVPADRRGERLDQALAVLLPALSRAAIQRLIRGGRVTLAGRPARSSRRMLGGERIGVEIPAPEPSRLEPEARDLDILHEDADLLVVNKPAGLAVHPGAGRRGGTLVNALLHHCHDLSGIGGVERPGVVHRLDRETSGVMVVAKNDRTHRDLAAQFKGREVRKIYLALAWGRPRVARGVIEAPIGRHPTARVRMAIRPDGRPSRTAWEVVEELGPIVRLDLRPVTGRTHQIRVHLASLGHPILGDRLYGGRRAPSGPTEETRSALSSYEGLALHARRLEFRHPRTGRSMAFDAPCPDPLARLIATLRMHAAAGRPGR